MRISVLTLLFYGVVVQAHGTTVVTQQAGARPVACRLEATPSGSFAGQCQTGQSGTLQIELARPVSASDALWTGTLSAGGNTLPLEIATYQYSAGPRIVARTGAWHSVMEFTFSETGLTVAWDEAVEAPPSQKDLAILRAASVLLSDEEMWDREDDRNCENDSSTRISLYCALAQATRQEMGVYQHRQPAMQAVRRIIRSEWPERIVDHRLMNFNNDPRTTLADVQRLFQLAEESLLEAVR